MDDFDLIIKNGTLATASAVFDADIGIRGGRIAAIADSLTNGAREIDASGKLVMPGGVDSHCHLDQDPYNGSVCADDFYSGTVSAAFGGTTTVIPFAQQKPGKSLREALDAYRAKAEAKAVIDYGIHMILTDPNEQAMGQELPALVADGISSIKVYMTYEGFRLDDHAMLTVLDRCRDLGVMTMVHAENDDIIRWLSEKLLSAGKRALKHHADAHHRIAEGEATRRAIDLARLTKARMLIVHISDEGATRAIRDAQSQGLSIHGETCPQYLFLTEADLDRPRMEGAKFCCSPPPRDTAAQETLWRGLANGTFEIYSSDHSPSRFDETGKLRHGPKAAFNQVDNGVPGLELRLPLLFSEGVGKGRISLERFVALSATNAARLYGLYPRKGTLAIGADADIAIWDPTREVSITDDLVHDNCGYTPYAGRTVTGWPEIVISRGRVIVDNGALDAEKGTGKFISRATPAA